MANDPRLEAMGDTPGSDVCGCTRVMLSGSDHEYVIRAEADEAGRVYVETNKGNIWPTGIVAPSLRCLSDITAEEWGRYMNARLRDAP